MNELYRPTRTATGAAIRKSEKATAWASRAKYDVQIQRQGMALPGRFRAHILIARGSKHDSDAPIKEVLDACQHGGAIVNDRLCEGGTWDYDDTLAGHIVRVELVSLEK
jgi:Holliday junction resolvase RusA-like endonuclease